MAKDPAENFESIVDYTTVLDNFEGPLDLLLFLIKQEKIEIKDIFVSQVTDQYLQYIASMDVIDVEKASEYLGMAATLVEIKSKALLPKPEEFLEDIEDPEQALIRQLEEYKIIAGDAGVSGVSSLHGITLFSVLGILSRNVPELEQFLDAPSIHPWPVYRALCRLVGELSVFSATLTALGETPQGTRALPPYDHEDLQACFRAACGIIARLVDTFVIGPAFTFPLETQGRPDRLGVVLPQTARTGTYSYWLLVRSARPEGLAERMERLAKLAPTESIDGIIAQALPGVRLRASAQPPAGLPQRTDTLYFTIDQNDPLWRKIMQQGNLALTFPSPPEDLAVVLAVIQR